MRYRYPIAVEPGDDRHAYGVIVPDLPGCFSAGDTLDEAIRNAREAIELHLEGLVEDKSVIPRASSVQAHVGKPEFAGHIWEWVEVGVAR
ncbi:type II toxin-antitoxin system HicB family antitoxin [Chromobacterium aquaticum]|uniref:Type II toxin-antitoxin system HicB family antitoxin n=1 Tax=Chromobacterium aquaticum TaxID=467180 RepID=A0ABV8ZUR8_9NEIS|nr:type II toxin-antitoxin system HicB family antitoxin [Chromobacterium aquaticum]MCD5362518.1 type II toxin-antitoxin system HicB family antitoxin [Chromobacterium aquaticum]